ncbi:hypothetical protein [Streptomyces aidingensis]|uniref:Pilus assembly protein Flp/PilA n=1 Tax=Streptomyces aidingensis TaxID=910347 RepID=A0A1I1ENS9_9ACTN|nr:hypothetical protein [Streptomyces aidingensis]SFB88677.1 hypothetical protein SAMN05421773_101388 [Streptomyces aidingensis]
MGRVISGWGRRTARRLRGADGDRGAGFVEYAGLLLLIASIVVAVVALGLDETIANAIQGAVEDILE